jgi:hypothetical protein
MGRSRVTHISYTLFFLALVEVLAWSLPLVHSAVGGSSEDLQGYFSRELHNTGQLDSSWVSKRDAELEEMRLDAMKRYVGEQEVEQLTKSERDQLSELVETMGQEINVRKTFNLSLLSTFKGFDAQFLIGGLIRALQRLLPFSHALLSCYGPLAS